MNMSYLSSAYVTNFLNLLYGAWVQSSKPRGAKTPFSVTGQWDMQEVGTQCFSEVMVKLLLTAAIGVRSAAFHPWMKEFHTAGCLQEGLTQCFSEVMVTLLLAAKALMDNAPFHLWMKDFHTSRFLQENFIQCFSEVMVRLWHVV